MQQIDNTKFTLEKLSESHGLVKQFAPISLLRERAMQRKVANQPFSVMYGETYDVYGTTIDSLRYYFMTDAIVRSLQAEGIDVRGEILIGDVAASLNVPALMQGSVLALGQERKRVMDAIISTYNLKLTPILMSSIVHTPAFIEKRDFYFDTCHKDSTLMSALIASVPAAKLAQEQANRFSYSLDEVTLIIDKDVKVGPPREDVYDSLARLISRQQNKPELASVYLTQTFPLGKGWSYFFANQQIEEFGVTAYKAGHLDLQDSRLRIGSRQATGALDSLIETTYVPRNIDVPNPLLHLLQVGLFAKVHLKSDRDLVHQLPLNLNPLDAQSYFFSEAVQSHQPEFKQLTKRLISNYVFEPINAALQNQKNAGVGVRHE